jgi:hypothetical protein
MRQRAAVDFAVPWLAAHRRPTKGGSSAFVEADHRG